MKICVLACGVFLAGEYIIIYRAEREDVLILHVIRASRDMEALLGH